MADIVNVLTNAGSTIIACALAGQTVSFTGVRFGSTCFTGSDINTKAKANGVMSSGGGTGDIGAGNILTKTSNAGTLTISVSWSNASYAGSATKINEIGLYAKTSSTYKTAVLFGYLSLGDYGSNISTPDHQAISRIFDIPYSFGSSSSTVSILPSGYLSAESASSTAQSGKLLYVGLDGKMAVDITGDAHTLGGYVYTHFATADHTHSGATTSADGFMSKSDKTALNTLNGRVNQDVRSSAKPTFAGINLNGGYIDNAAFR